MFIAELLKQKVNEAHQALQQEFDNERQHHQKMVSDYTRLQQRFENLQGDIQLLTSPPPGNPPSFARETLYEKDDAEQQSQQVNLVSIAKNFYSVLWIMHFAFGDRLSLFRLPVYVRLQISLMQGIIENGIAPFCIGSCYTKDKCFAGRKELI